MLTAISPIDGRYAGKTKQLSEYFSEFALIKYRVLVEIRYFVAICEIPLPQLAKLDKTKLKEVEGIATNFTLEQAQQIKDIERTTNHDVKAVEYFIKSEFDKIGLAEFKEFIHFGLTSQDINNTATPMLTRDAVGDVYLPELKLVRDQIYDAAQNWSGVALLARTHGQPASPTRLGKEFMVFVERLDEQLRQLNSVPWRGKFGGATGNFNAHHVAYPAIDWVAFGNGFLEKHLGLVRSQFTTQIEHYDNLAAVFHALSRINTILIDLCRDIWTYISMDYFKQKTVKGEIGSSAMPHKVNPIDFENAEGNLGLANAFFGHLAEKLPISRLQRDLTDSTVLRNVGVPFGHTAIALQSIQKGLSKLVLNEAKLKEDLENNWMVVAEAIQTILRREGYPQPYEALKELTRGKAQVTRSDIHEFIDGLEISEAVRTELKRIEPGNYVGI
ncbi:MAG: adenylosuccinate lyase [Saprospiraceae bacterium]|nr:adenylosuccinate lyase [Saprospiraceae bacterium]MCF8248853.1 adenylosuccinate lyase [Saprospiraceae bacterium]MCF8279578.1 adenylosuccinate lyase [Bacteroidales bacterium]MCF8310138.1 adenylosuccinate lyase [Saprospiraceae bacterium]MCF8439038.1 adenylosuccinate lyase [Saprospiraceae bacterium]